MNEKDFILLSPSPYVFARRHEPCILKVWLYIIYI